ncbi:MAG: 4'-phosphopantetheinyl transferase superfamily protein [Dysgonamonadaceae bacterium]|nr:4'-phosphopantetheinyl transferase superfamily protein [Dysgonamonadaceae bacterium]
MKSDILILSITKYMLSNYYGINNSDVKIYKNHWGKPMIRGISNVHFNFSHTNDIIVGAFSTKQIGIDVEKVRRFNPKILKLFCSKEEMSDLSTIEDMHRLTQIWSIKESYLKMLGVGLNLPMNKYSTCRLDNQIRLKGKNGLISNVSFNLVSAKNIVISVCYILI